MLFLVCFSMVLCSVSAQDDKSFLLRLEGSWKFSINDSMKWAKPGFDDSKWESIRVPSAWEDQGFYGYDGYAWYRTSFAYNKDMRNKDLYLDLGYIDDVDQVYLNGHLIGFSGAFPPQFSTAFEARRKYPVPEEYLNQQGKNVIAVRVYNQQMSGGILSGEIGICYSNAKPDLSLIGLWSFRTGDNKQWKSVECKDKAWKKIVVPGNWENQGYIDYDGFAWYRRHFTASDELINQKLMFVVGRISNIAEVYLNGVLIGSTGKMPKDNDDVTMDEGKLRKCSAFNVPENLLIHSKDNVIAIKVYNVQHGGGIVDGPVGFVKLANYNRYFKDLVVNED